MSYSLQNSGSADSQLNKKLRRTVLKRETQSVTGKENSNFAACRELYLRFSSTESPLTGKIWALYIADMASESICWELYMIVSFTEPPIHCLVPRYFVLFFTIMIWMFQTIAWKRWLKVWKLLQKVFTPLLARCKPSSLCS